MRKLRLALLMFAALGVGRNASAQSAYGDDWDGPYEDENTPFFRDRTPEPPPPPPPPARSDSPYELLPDLQAPEPQAQQQVWRYNGPHAINAEYGSGWCDVEQPHTHTYPPFDDHLFQENQGGYDFLGDPTDFGYTGDDLSWFYGAHPIAAGFGAGWCFIPWPHRHVYAPFGSFFSMCGSYWCYGGPYDAWYWSGRPNWYSYWTSHYPPHYRGGRYYGTRVPASPGRFGRSPGRTTPSGRPATPSGRPGGYARPMPHRPAPLVTRPTPRTYQAPRAMRRSYGAPRAFGMPRPYGAPRPYLAPRPMMPPRSYGAPRPAAPRFGSPSFGGRSNFGAPRYSAPRPAAPSPARPSGGGFHGPPGGGARRR